MPPTCVWLGARWNSRAKLLIRRWFGTQQNDRGESPRSFSWIRRCERGLRLDGFCLSFRFGDRGAFVGGSSLSGGDLRGSSSGRRAGRGFFGFRLSSQLSLALSLGFDLALPLCKARLPLRGT